MLQAAAQRIGRDKLAERLNIPEHLLRDWMSGHATMPERKFLQLADLLDELGDDSPQR